jgi:hypothetical protein
MNRFPFAGLVQARGDARVVARPIVSHALGAENAWFQRASVLREACARRAPRARRQHCDGTTIAFDLMQLGGHARGAPRPAARRRPLHPAADSVRVRLCAPRIACAELARGVTQRPLGLSLVETSMTQSGDGLQMDVDRELLVGLSSPSVARTRYRVRVRVARARGRARRPRRAP